jgi:PAS domain S-box-containing protein
MSEIINKNHLTFQKLIEDSNWGITFLNAQFDVIYRSPVAERINGWDKRVRNKDNTAINIHPDDLEEVNALMHRVLQTQKSTETLTFRSKHFSGKYIWLQCSFTNMLAEPNVHAIVCNFIDVSTQKLGEIALVKQSEEITELLETMTDGFISLDENLRYTYVNGQILKISKKTRKELIGNYIWDVFPDVVGSATYNAIETAFTEKKYVCNEDFYEPLQLWQENRVYPSGNGLSLFIRDITKQKKEEHHLKLLESVITNTTDSVLITEAEPFDLPGPRILYVNEAFTRMTGYTAEEVIGKTPRILQGIKTDKEELKRIGVCLRNWEQCEATLINYKKNGEEFWINFSLNPVSDEKGWFTHWISIERDITHLKNEEIEKALLIETSKLFNEPMKLNLLLNKLLKKVVAFDHFGIAEIWLTGADKSKISLVAKAFRNQKNGTFYEETKQFLSFKKGESLPGAVWESGKILLWDDLDNRSAFLRSKAAQNAGIKMVYGIPLLSEKVMIGVMMIGIAKEKPEIAVFLMSLFEKLSAHFGEEIKRKKLEEELHQIFNLAPDIICTLGTDSYFKKVNPAMKTLLGYSASELLEQPLDTFLYPDDRFSSKLRMDKFLAGEKNLSFEIRFLTKTGEILWLSWTAHLNQQEGLLFCVGKDITARKNNESLVLESEKRYSELFHLSPLSILVFDLENFRILDVNDAAVSQYGYSIEEFSQMTIKQLRPQENMPLSANELLDLVQETGIITKPAITHQKKNGEKISVDIRSNPIFYKGKKARIAVTGDITESLNYIQEIEKQNEKLREISWMQSHVVRAPLARLMGLISVIDMNEELPAETKKIMDYIIKSAHELDDVIRDITLKTECTENKKFIKNQ